MAGSMSALTKKPAAAAAAAGVPRTAALGAGRRAPQPAARHAWAAARGRTQQHGIRAGISSDQFDSGTKFADSMRPAHYDPDKAMWPNPPFVEATLAKFPEAGVANVEEGRVSPFARTSFRDATRANPIPSMRSAGPFFRHPPSRATPTTGSPRTASLT